MAKLLMKWFQVTVLTGSLMLTSSSWADGSADVVETQRPDFVTVMGDIAFARPIALIAMAGGSVLFVVTLPATLITGTVGEAGMTLVGDPALNLFARCLGCTEVGWRKLPPKDQADEGYTQ